MGVSVPGEATAEGRPTSSIRAVVDAVRSALTPLRTLLSYLEIDTRLVGMVAALLIIWVGFSLVSNGTFLTARNLWNLSVQSASIGVPYPIMAAESCDAHQSRHACQPLRS